VIIQNAGNAIPASLSQGLRYLSWLPFLTAAFHIRILGDGLSKTRSTESFSQLFAAHSIHCAPLLDGSACCLAFSSPMQPTYFGREGGVSNRKQHSSMGPPRAGLHDRFPARGALRLDLVDRSLVSRYRHQQNVRIKKRHCGPARLMPFNLPGLESWRGPESTSVCLEKRRDCLPLPKVTSHRWPEPINPLFIQSSPTRGDAYGTRPRNKFPSTLFPTTVSRTRAGQNGHLGRCKRERRIDCGRRLVSGHTNTRGITERDPPWTRSG
jgi:hypothetical protein